MTQEDPKSLGIKSCRSCLEEKPLSSFVKNHLCSDGFDSICLVCNRSRVKSWRKKNPEKRAEQLKKEAKQDYNKNKYLKANYNITLPEYNRMFLEQAGCCAICGIHQSKLKRALSVDHCHTTGKVRQLLCGHCNSIEGLRPQS
jgi:hypothetical protein